MGHLGHEPSHAGLHVRTLPHVLRVLPRVDERSLGRMRDSVARVLLLVQGKACGVGGGEGDGGPLRLHRHGGGGVGVARVGVQRVEGGQPRVGARGRAVLWRGVRGVRRGVGGAGGEQHIGVVRGLAQDGILAAPLAGSVRLHLARLPDGHRRRDGGVDQEASARLSRHRPLLVGAIGRHQRLRPDSDRVVPFVHVVARHHHLVGRLLLHPFPVVLQRGLRLPRPVLHEVGTDQGVVEHLALQPLSVLGAAGGDVPREELQLLHVGHAHPLGNEGGDGDGLQLDRDGLPSLVQVGVRLHLLLGGGGGLLPKLVQILHEGGVVGQGHAFFFASRLRSATHSLALRPSRASDTPLAGLPETPWVSGGPDKKKKEWSGAT